MSDRHWIEPALAVAFAAVLAGLAFQGGVRHGVRVGGAAVRDSAIAADSSSPWHRARRPRTANATMFIEPTIDYSCISDTARYNRVLEMLDSLRARMGWSPIVRKRVFDGVFMNQWQPGDSCVYPREVRP